MQLSIWMTCTALLLLCSIELGVCALVDSATYKISFGAGAGVAEPQCQGFYLSYDPSGKVDVPFLAKASGASASAAAALWQVNMQGSQKISLKAVSIPDLAPKLGYFSECSYTTVKLNTGVDLNLLWRLVPVNGTVDTYALIPVEQANCKSGSGYVLGVKASSAAASGASACGRGVGLVAKGKKSQTPKMIWKFTRVKTPASPPPRRAPPSQPSPPAVIEKTVVASVTFISLNQTCSSISQAELQKITQDLCSRQVNYTLSQGWPRKQTTCDGTARCASPKARQAGSSSTSEHPTELALISTPGQSQTADGVANSLSQAISQPQTFYANSLPAGAGATSSQSTVILPSGGASPTPSPGESPSPGASPALSPTINTVPVPDSVVSSPNPNYNPLPTPVPTPSGGGGGTPTPTPTPTPPPPPAVNYAYITNNNAITRCTLNNLGGFSQCVNTAPTGGFNLNSPKGLAISVNNAYIANSSPSTITRCTMSAGAFVSCSVATPSTGGFNMNAPTGIAISGGYAYITNSGAAFANANSVTKCSLDGGGAFTACVVNTPNTGQWRLDVPKGIAIANNIAYITNAENNYGFGQSVTQCMMSGSAFTSCAVATLSSGTFNMNQPVGIQIVGDYAFITNLGSWSITRCTLDAATKLISICEAGMAGAPAWNMMGPYNSAFLSGYSYTANSFENTVTKCSYDAFGVFSSCAVITPNTGAINVSQPYGIAIAGF